VLPNCVIACCRALIQRFDWTFFMVGLELAMIGEVVEGCNVQDAVDDGSAGEYGSGF